MKKGIKYGIKLFLYYTGISKFVRCWYNKSVTKGYLLILAYHRVDDSEYGYESLSISIHNFEKQLRHLQKYYKVISLNELCEFIRSEKGLPEGYVAITFDDGYKDNYTNAYQILKKHKMTATFYLTTGYIGTAKMFWWDRVARIAMAVTGKKIKIDMSNDTYPENIKRLLKKIFASTAKDSARLTSLITSELKRISEQKKLKILDDLEHKLSGWLKDVQTPPPNLSWEEVKEMSNEGMEFGSHTVTHPIITGVTHAQAKNEIQLSKSEIEKRIGKHVRSFAYPNGKSSDINEDIINIIKESKYLNACLAIEGINDLKSDLYALKRNLIGNYTICEFDFELLKAAGAFGAINEIYRRIIKKHR